MFSCLSKEEVTKYSISEDILEVRDALAHGRLVAPDPPELPYALGISDSHRMGKLK